MLETLPPDRFFRRMKRGGRITREFAVFLALFFIVWTLRATCFYAIDETITAPRLKLCYSVTLKLLFWVLPAVGFARWYRSQDAVCYLGVGVFPTWESWKPCLAVITVFLLTMTLLERSLGSPSISIRPLLSTSPIVALLAYFLSPCMEELLFRGLVLKELLQLLPTTAAIVISALLFVGVHLPHWIFHKSFLELASNSAGVLCFGLLAGWLYARTGSIWPPTLAHILNNLAAAALEPMRS